MQVSDTPPDNTDTTTTARRTTRTPPSDTDEALARFLDADPAIKQAKLRHNISKVIVQMVTGLPKFSAPHCAAAMEPDQWEDLQTAYRRMGDWIEEVRALRDTRTTLRLVK